MAAELAGAGLCAAGRGMSGFDWPGLMRAGLRGLGLAPEAFWRLTPVELRIMLGPARWTPPLTRARLEELARRFPGRGRGRDDGGDRRLDGPGGGAGGDAWAARPGWRRRFDGELARMRESLRFTGREVNTLSSGISGGLAAGV